MSEISNLVTTARRAEEVKMTPEQRQELQDFRELLNEEQQAYIDLLIENKGEEYVLSRLGWLKGQLDYVNHL